MNLENRPTVEQLCDLVKGCDDQKGHHVLWVEKNGDVHVSLVPEGLAPGSFEEQKPEMQLRYEIFQAGNGYVGTEAAEDADWVEELFDALVSEWPKVKGKPTVEVEYIDQF